MLVDDWLALEGGESKYPGLEMKWEMRGKDLELVICLEEDVKTIPREGRKRF